MGVEVTLVLHIPYVTEDDVDIESLVRTVEYATEYDVSEWDIEED